jgi:hypothetical protein
MERSARAPKIGVTMNTVADKTRQLARQTAMSDHGRQRARSLRSSTRRLATWWSADPMSERFSAAREHDRRLLQRVGR